MTVKKATPITDREIRGLTWKQVWPVIVAVVAGVLFYVQIRTQTEKAYEQSAENYKILKEIQSERKEDERVNNVRLNAIENGQTETRIRLTQLETQLNIKN